jgi:hypothetical protein
LNAAILIAQGEKDSGLSLLKEIVEATRKEVKAQRLVNLKVKKMLDTSETLLTAVQTEREKFVQNHTIPHKHAGIVSSLGISLNSEYLTSVAADETNVWLIKNHMV